MSLDAQSVLTCVMPVAPGANDGLRRELAAMQQRAAAEKHGELDDVDGLHFARFVVLESGRDAHGHYVPPALAFSTWHDGSLGSHITNLSHRAGRSLARALSHCEGFQARRSRQTEVARFLRAHRAPTLAHFNSAPKRPVGRIQQERRMVDALRSRVTACTTQDSYAIYNDLRRQAQADRSLQWLFQPAADFGLSPTEKATRWLTWLLRTAPQWTLFFLTLPALRRMERREAQGCQTGSSLPAPPSQAGADSTQNAYNSVTVVKPGSVRSRALRLFLELLTTVGSMRTDLSGIVTMRFAHWAELNEGRRMLFCSVYDGAWEAYMADFIELASWGLTGVWSNTQGFPDTDWLILNGARREHGFRRFVREAEVPTPFFYRRYPGPSCENIADATRVRTVLEQGTPTASEAESWLSLL